MQGSAGVFGYSTRMGPRSLPRSSIRFAHQHTLRAVRYRPLTCCSPSPLLVRNYSKSRFDASLVTADYEQRTQFASLNRNCDTSLPPFRIVLPPPNVTGKLHLGHALTVTIEDAMCRYNRAYRRQVSWIPGFDHAGIATQAVVEKQLWKERHLRRFQIPPAEFLHLCNEWKNSRIADISMQLKKLGATLDWNAAYFTMDEHFSKAVAKAFCQLHREGLIFNDCRLVNWCPTLQSAISDQEVDRVELANVDSLRIPSSEGGDRTVVLGKMHRVRYTLVDTPNDSVRYLEAATTRPETVFADIALAVNPSDSRYTRFIGRFVTHPLIPDRRMPVVADTAVKPDKGTGVLKITPTHDFVDFEIWRRHSAEMGGDALDVSCVDEQGFMKNAGLLTGVDRFVARERVIEMLSERDAYGGEAANREGHVAVCSRTGDIVEPMLKRQWFMHCDEINDVVIRALAEGKLKVSPECVRSPLEEWLRNKEPWCLSRQLVWGHRIPAFRRHSNSEWIVAECEEEARSILKLGNDSEGLERDPDVLDTWFSSALIPLVTAGYPEKKIDFVPLSVMETGHDIIGFWVARMLTLCHRLSGKFPFNEIALHGLVRDGRGRKMSKSLGNVIDPNDVIDGISLENMLKRLQHSSLSPNEQSIAEAELRSNFPTGMRSYGVDALRYSLLRHDVAALDVNLNIADAADEGLKFCNKLWNLCAYMEVVESKFTTLDTKKAPLSIADHWILSRLGRAFREVRTHMNEYRPHLALTALRQFFVADLCDVYLETTKKAMWGGDSDRALRVSAVLQEVIQPALALLSAFLPFTSEYLFNRVTHNRQLSMYDVSLSEIEMNCNIDSDLELKMDVAIAIVSAVRSLRQELDISPKVHFDVSAYGSEKHDVMGMREVVTDLANVTLCSFSALPASPLKYSFPISVVGFPVVLGVHLEKDFSNLFRERLSAQLKKFESRKRQFILKAEKHERFCEDGSARPQEIIKNEKKALQARGVCSGLDEEIRKLKGLLALMDDKSATAGDVTVVKQSTH